MTKAMKHQGRVAIITGAGSGIGRATAFALARDNVAIVAVGRRVEPLEQLRNDLADTVPVAVVAADVTDDDAPSRAAQTAITDFGRLDYLVNNAGTPGTSSPIRADDFARMDEAFWAKLVSINQIGPYRCLKAAAPHLKKSKGAVVNVASTAGLGYGGSSSVYASTKAAIILLTTEWAHAMGPEVRVNAIAPNVVDGSGWDCRFDPDQLAQYVSKLPLKRPGTPADYAETIFYLLAGAPYITGQTIVMDGGGAR